jgi:hypothetical protein
VYKKSVVITHILYKDVRYYLISTEICADGHPPNAYIDTHRICILSR